MSDQPKTLFTTVNAYLDSLHQSKTKASTVKIYERCLDEALQYFGGDRKLDSILVLHTGKFFAQVGKHPKTGKPRAKATVKQVKRVFRQCMEFAQSEGLIHTLPIPKSELLHARNKKTSTKTPKPEATEADQPVSQS